jgi:hypothetical protein
MSERHGLAQPPPLKFCGLKRNFVMMFKFSRGAGGSKIVLDYSTIYESKPTAFDGSKILVAKMN